MSRISNIFRLLACEISKIGNVRVLNCGEELLLHVPSSGVYILARSDPPTLLLHFLKYYRCENVRGWRLPFPIYPISELFTHPYSSIIELVSQYDTVSDQLLSGCSGDEPSLAVLIGAYFGKSLDLSSWSSARDLELRKALGDNPFIYMVPENISSGMMFKVADPAGEKLERYYTPPCYVFPRMDLAVIPPCRELSSLDMAVFHINGIYRSVFPPLRPCLKFLGEIFKNYSYLTPRRLIEEMGIDRLVTAADRSILPLASRLVRRIAENRVDETIRKIVKSHGGEIHDNYEIASIFFKNGLHMVGSLPGVLELYANGIEFLDELYRKLREAGQGVGELYLLDLEDSTEGRFIFPIYEVERDGRYYYILLPSLGLALSEPSVIPLICYMSSTELVDMLDLLPVLALDHFLPLFGQYYLDSDLNILNR